VTATLSSAAVKSVQSKQDSQITQNQQSSRPFPRNKSFSGQQRGTQQGYLYSPNRPPGFNQRQQWLSNTSSRVKGPFCRNCNTNHPFGQHTSGPFCRACNTYHPYGQHVVLITCYACGRNGHTANNCRNKQTRPTQPSNMINSQGN